jgi:hypothetical protein
MPVEQLAPPTLTEVERDIAVYEDRYQMTTADFLAADGCVSGIDEDDAVEWLYRAEQRRVLQEPEFSSPYSRCDRAKPLNGCTNVMDVMDRLAA